MWNVYVLRCSDESLYVGMTKDMQHRLSEHMRGVVGWTGPRLPVVLMHHETFCTRPDAREREKYLKSGWGKQWLKKKLGRSES